MKINFTNEVSERFDYYQKLGYTKSQCLTLAMFQYDDSKIWSQYINDPLLIQAINLSGKGQFCDGIIEFLSDCAKTVTEDIIKERIVCPQRLLLNYVGYKKAMLSKPSNRDGVNIKNYAENIFVTNTNNNIEDEEICSALDIPYTAPKNDEECTFSDLSVPGYFAAKSVRKYAPSLGSLGAAPPIFSPSIEECETEEEYEESPSYGSFHAVEFLQAPSTSIINNISSGEYLKVPNGLVGSFKNFAENVRWDKYKTIEEKGFRSVGASPTSTFRTTCNTASMGILKNNIENDSYINKSMVRLEELMNYFEYDVSKPSPGEFFKIHTEIANKPYSDNKLLFVHMKGKDLIHEKQNIVLLLDASGSMGGTQTQMQSSMMTIISHLNEGDKLSLITYSDDDVVVLDNITFSKDKVNEIIENILKIEITGCTNGSGGLKSAYKRIKKNFVKDGVNRVIILTDGDFNFGITGASDLEDFIAKKKETGAYLSVIGTNLWNTNDETMETLAKNGNGNYCVVNSIDDVEEFIEKRYDRLVHTIATDVKAQVEFNPKYVKNYRLIGFENRSLNHEDFKNDKVISEPFGCGSYCVALYELELNENIGVVESDLKYQKPQLIDSDNLCTVSIRYKDLGKDSSDEVSKDVPFEVTDMSYNMKIAYCAYLTGEKLRNSKMVEEDDFALLHTVLDKMQPDEINNNRILLLKRMSRYENIERESA